MQNTVPFFDMASILQKRPQALSVIRGGSKHPGIQGLARFYQIPTGVILLAELTGLPTTTDPCKKPIFGFHIHGGGSCDDTTQEAFTAAGGHYNPQNCPHPHHAGDLPPLFGVHGRALSAFLTDRFTVEEIIGKTVILHARPDDFTSQPAGNAGDRIACGVIIRATAY